MVWMKSSIWYLQHVPNLSSLKTQVGHLKVFLVLENGKFSFDMLISSDEMCQSKKSFEMEANGEMLLGDAAN